MPRKKKAKKVTAVDVENLEKIVARLKKDNKQLRDSLRKELNKHKNPRSHQRKSSSTLLKKQLASALTQISSLEKGQKHKKKRAKRRPERGEDGALRAKLIKIQKQLDLQKKVNRKNERKIKKAKAKIQELLDKIAKSSAMAKNLKRDLQAAKAKYDKLLARIEKLKKLRKPIPKADREELKATSALIVEIERRLVVVTKEIDQNKAEEEKMRTTVATTELELRRTQDEENNLNSMVTHLEGVAESGDLEEFEKMASVEEEEMEKRSAEQKQAELQGLEQTILQLTNDHDEMEAELEMRDSEIKLKDHEIKDLVGANEVLNAQISALNMQLEKLETEGNLAKLQHHSSFGALMDDPYENEEEESLEDQLAELRFLLDDMAKQKQELEETNGKLDEELADVREQLKEYENPEQKFEFKLLEAKAMYGDDMVKLKVDFEKTLRIELNKKEKALEAKHERRLTRALSELQIEHEEEKAVLTSPRTNEIKSLRLELDNLKLQLGNRDFMLEQLQSEKEYLKGEQENAAKLEQKMQNELDQKVKEAKATYEGQMKAHVEEMKKSFEVQMTEKIEEEAGDFGKLKLELDQLKLEFDQTKLELELELDAKNMELQSKDLELNTVKDELEINVSKLKENENDLDNLKSTNKGSREQMQEQVNAKVREVKDIYENQLSARVAKMKEQYEGQMNKQLEQLKLKYETQIQSMQLEAKNENEIKQVHVEVAIDASEREKELEHQIRLLKDELTAAQNSIKYASEGSVEDVAEIPEEERLPEVDAPRTAWLAWYVQNIKDEDLLGLLETHPETTERLIYVYGQSVASKANQKNANTMANLNAQVNRANNFMDILRPVLKSLGLRGGDLQSEAGLSKLSALLHILQKQVLEFQGRVKELEGEKKRLKTRLEYSLDKIARTPSFDAKFEN